jgi:RHS repeat-associated protein
MDKGGTAPEGLRLPSGGGAVTSIGADFKTNLNTGVGTYSIPIELPSGFRAQSPQLALQYSSGAGHGEFGLGWGLPTLSLRRDNRNGFPQYDDSDTFLLNGEEVIPLGDGLFRPRLDTTFQRVRRLEVGWEVTDRQGTRFFLGASAASQERHPDRAGEDGVASWLVERVVDTSGNVTTYSYLEDGHRLYLHRLDYAMFRMEVEYEERPDIRTVRRNGFAQRTGWRARRIAVGKTTLDPSRLRAYDFAYVEDPLAGHSLLSSVTLTGFLFTDAGEVTEHAPPLRFEYAPFDPVRRQMLSFKSSESDGPPGLSTPSIDVVDLEGFGLPGVLEAGDVVHRYWPNRGRASWGVPVRLRQFPQGASLANDEVRFGDMDGDGRADLLVSSGALSGYYPGEAGMTWGNLRPYRHDRPTFDVRDRHVRWLDANADGRVDAMLGRGNGFLLYEGRGADGWAPTPHVIPRRREDPTFPDVTLADPRVRLADMTGDGLSDIVRLFAHHIEYWPSIGVGQWDQRKVLLLPGNGPARFDPVRCHLTDINGDGVADVVYVDDDAIYVWVNHQGERMVEAAGMRYPPPAAPTTIRVTDMLGTGTAGLLFGMTYRPGRRELYRYLDFTGGTKPYLLSRIDNGVGKVTEIVYGSSTAHRLRDRDAGRDWNTFLPRAVQVVDRIRNLDMVTGRQSTTTNSYHDGQYDARAQRFIGFGAVDSLEEYGAAPVLTRHFFHLGQPGESPDVSPAHSAARRGLLFRKEVYGPDGSDKSQRAYTVERTEWAVRVVATADGGREILFPHTRTRRVERSERTDAASQVITELEHDDFGNVTVERRRGMSADPAAPEPVVEIQGAYINDTENWILGLPTRRTLCAGGKTLDDVRMYYDEQPFGVSTQGLLTRRERLAFTGGLLEAVFAGIELPDLTTLGYHERAGAGDEIEYWFDEYRVAHDERGNIIEHRDAFGHPTNIDYDPEHALYPIKSTNAAGHVYQASYHPRLDAITTFTDPNGRVTTYDYTPLGRVRREVRPGDSEAWPTVEYEYHADSLPLSTVMIRRRTSGEAATRRSISFYDGQGNTVQTRARLDDGRFQVARTEIRDLRGLVVEAHPSFISPSADFDAAEGLDPDRRYRYSYDPLKRAIEVIDPAGQRSSSVLAPDWLTFFDTQDNDVTSPFANTPRIQRVDPFGRVIAVEEVTDTGTLTTSYDYDPAGRLVEITDASGTPLLSQTVDLAGRKLRIVHRDAGARRFLYDGRGSLALYVDGAGRMVSWSFDEIGRKLTVAYDGEVVERFHYDAGDGENLIGKLAEAEDRIGRQRFSYDARGRVQRTQRFVQGIDDPFEYAFSYDPDDRPLQVTYPDGGVANSTYDALGRLSRLSGLINTIVYDAEGRRARVTYASGLEETRVYDPSLGRLQEQALINPATGQELFRQRLTYDSASNVLGIEDARAPGPGIALASRAFEYDALSRLLRAHGGPAASAYDHHYAYDAIGNMTLNQAWRPETLVYEGAHLRGIEGAGGPETLFTYDANGCLRTRPGMTLSFDPRDLLQRVVRDDGTTVEFAYDYSARRIRKRVITGDEIRDTLYIGEGFEVRPDGARLRYVTDPESSATLVVRGGAVHHVLHHDYLGNVILVREAASGVAHEVHYSAYGRHLNPGDEFGEILFAGQRLDPETGLYYIRMRYYDPVLGRFISPDPVAVVNAERGRLRPLSLNPYVYTLDNPLRYNDVNGLWTFWEGFLTVLMVAVIIVATALTFGAAGVIALAIGAAVGGLIGGLTTGSVDGALAGAMLGFGIVATALSGVYLGGLIGGAFGGAVLGTNIGAFVGGALAGIQALGFIPSVRQNETYKDILGYSSWLNPWSWPGHIVGGIIFIINAIVYGVAYLVTWGDPPEWADMSVSFEQGMVVTEGGWIRPGRAFNFGLFTNVNPNDPAIQNPTDRALVLRHERGHMLNNAYFGILQAGRVGSGSEEESFWEQLAESNVNPNVPGLTGNKDERRRAGGRGFGDVPWWNP